MSLEKDGKGGAENEQSTCRRGKASSALDDVCWYRAARCHERDRCRVRHRVARRGKKCLAACLHRISLHGVDSRAVSDGDNTRGVVGLAVSDTSPPVTEYAAAQAVRLMPLGQQNVSPLVSAVQKYPASHESRKKR
jgi:hypothetical protein